MPTVGVRELKNKLSSYLKRVEKGERIEVTHRGEVIALLVPARVKKIDKGLVELMEQGVVSWSGGKPRGSSHPVEVKGRPLSEVILEDRR